MKIIFVGIHNKQGKQPLCSSTRSGKLIDRIIKELDGRCRWSGSGWWLKTNLYDLEYLPIDKEIKVKQTVNFYYRVMPNDDDIFVLLGAEVSNNFFNKGAKNIVEIHHPSCKRSHKAMDEYVKHAANKIEDKIRENNL